MKKFSLINSEGDILSVKKSDRTGFYTLVDNFGFTLYQWTLEEVIDFLIGNTTVCDSQGRMWSYSNLDKNMKAQPDKIIAFLKESL